MIWPSFYRAHRLDRSSPSRIAVVVFGNLSALLLPILILILGLVVQLLIERELTPAGGEALLRKPSSDWVIGPLVNGPSWPWFGRHDYCLLALLGIGLSIALVMSGSLIGLYIAVYRSTLEVVSRLRESIHSQSFRLGSSDLLDVHGSQPEQLFSEKVDAVQEGLIAWRRALPRSAVALVTLLILAMMVDRLATVLAVLMALMIWRAYLWLQQRSNETSNLWIDRAKRQHELLQEGLRLAPFTSSLSHSRKSTTAFAEGLRSYCAWMEKSGAARTTVAPILLFIVLLAVAGMLLVIGLSKHMTVASCVTLGTALICAYFPASRLYRLPSALGPAERAAHEIFAYLEREPRVLQLSGARVLESIESGIELDQVTVADFRGNKLLEDICLAVPVGGRVGMMASDPRTPMALAGLLVRFYDPTFGRVLFDSRDIRHVTLDSLREQAALIRYHNVLLTGSVSENITCGDSRFSLLQITEAAKRAGVDEFIQRLPQGFDTIIGDHGERLDVEQTFRIILARAVLREPSLLLIDEPTTANSNGASDGIDRTLKEVSQNRTLIYLPNRITTLRSLDRIYVFHEGKLHAQGTHSELIQSSELYRHLNYVQFNPFRAPARS